MDALVEPNRGVLQYSTEWMLYILIDQVTTMELLNFTSLDGEGHSISLGITKERACLHP